MYIHIFYPPPLIKIPQPFVDTPRRNQWLAYAGIMTRVCQDNLRSPRSSPTKEVMLAHKSNSQTLMKMSPGRPTAPGFCFEYTSHGVDRDFCGDICHEPIGLWSYKMSLSCAACLWRKYHVTGALTEVILLKMNGGKVTEYVNGELELEEVERFDIDLNERKLDSYRVIKLLFLKADRWSQKTTHWRRKPAEEGTVLYSNYWYHMPILVVKALSAWYEFIWYRFDLMFYDSMPWRSGPITLIGILLATTPHMAATTPTTTTNNTRN